MKGSHKLGAEVAVQTARRISELARSKPQVVYGTLFTVMKSQSKKNMVSPAKAGRPQLN